MYSKEFEKFTELVKVKECDWFTAIYILCTALVIL
jgi:hypothetical protein